MKQTLKKDHVKIRDVAEKNNDEYRESKKEIYLRIKREKKFWKEVKSVI